jgi:hypothetical protein
MIGVIIYHKNILNLYEINWIEKCLDSIKNQTLNSFRVYEIDYGNSNLCLSQNYFKDYKFYSKEMSNHAEAINFLFDEIINDVEIDCVANINLDDYYDLDRFELQYEKIKEGYDIISSNFRVFVQNGFKINFIENLNFAKKDILEEFFKDHNIIAHPVVMYSINFVKNNRYIPSDIPKEDFNLWKRTISKYKYIIMDEFLLNYRKHNSQITQMKNNTDLCVCGEIKRKYLYNYCPKCETLY